MKCRKASAASVSKTVRAQNRARKAARKQAQRYARDDWGKSRPF